MSRASGDPGGDERTRDAHIRQIAEAIEQVFFLTDPHLTEMLYVSPAYETVWGRSRESVYADPRSWLERVHPADRERVSERLHLQARGGWEEEFRLRLDDGRERWIRSRAFPIEGDDGDVVRVATVAEDITALKRAQEAATRSREDLREILERLPVAVVIHEQGRVLYANRTGLAYAGEEDLDDVIGRDLLELIHPEDVTRAQARMRRMAETGEPEPAAEMRLRHSSGEWRTLLSAPVRPIRFGGASAYLVVGWDLTEHRRVEAALAESQQRYGRVFASSGVGILVMDEETRILDANPAIIRLLRWPADTAVGRRMRELVHPEDRESWLELWTELESGGQELYDREVRLRREDGSWAWCHEHVSAVREADGRFTAVSVIDDISEQKRLEEQLRLSQRIESIGRLAGGVAHDFNNIITVIQGHTDLLLSDVGERDGLYPDLLQIRAAAARAAALTRQLLAFSRRQVLQPRIVDLNTVMRGMEPMLRRLIGEDVDLRFELSPDLGLVRADPGQIEQVVLNLVVNARDAMPRGGRLTVETHERHFGESFVRTHPGSSEGPYVGVVVRDTGHGMDEDTVALIFEPFFTTKEPGKGTGLGLAMSYGIVKQSGGYVLVESEPDEGSTFSIYLPRIEEGKPGQAPEPAAQGDGGSETILLVEDEPMVRELARRALQARGYDVLTAQDGEAALAVLDDHDGSLHLLLTDVVMPRMGGREVAERIRRRVPGLKVIFMSGYTDDAVVRHGVLEESTPFLQKPFTPDELADKIREVLDG
ncbi:MAG: PAS domain S-box protein [Gemmatimonadetes bacterium]|nr:PAS domain S-box protein [Gemmatimonadota bacterium]